MNKIGTLFIVATPIGNLGDFSQRAVDVLNTVDSIAAEDTRHSQKLLQKLHISTPLIAYHDFSSEQVANKILQRLRTGQSIALICDAGTPLISDPGYRLVKLARDAAIPVLPIPGACAVTAALSVAGLPTDKFVFEGFLPSKASARFKRLSEMATEARSLVIYESPHRIVESVAAIVEAFGADRQLFIGRELTKKFESHFVGSAGNGREWILQSKDHQKGEFVLVVAGCDQLELEARRQTQALDLVTLLRSDLSLKRAVAIASQLSGARKNQLYDQVIKSEA